MVMVASLGPETPSNVLKDIEWVVLTHFGLH